MARNATIVREIRATLSGKQSDENPHASLLSNRPSEPRLLGSRQLFLDSYDGRVGSGAAPALGTILASSGHSAGLREVKWG